MRDIIIKLGRVKLVLAITAISVFLAVALNYLIAKVFNHSLYMDDFLRAVLIPLVIAPLISWYLIGLVLTIDQVEQKMTLLASYDDLTGLLNRRAFLTKSNALHEYAIRKKEEYTILSIDLDHFKKINDTYGHGGGDAVLESFAHTARAVLRNSDLLSRVGGEEFVFFLPDTDSITAKVLSKRLQEMITDKEIIYNGNEIDYTISVGIAANSCARDVQLEEVINQSDEALYGAKRNGRNQAVTYADMIGGNNKHASKSTVNRSDPVDIV